MPGPPPMTTDLVLLADVATHLNWSTAEETAYAVPMARFISAATPIVEEITGPVVSRTFDEWYDGGSDTLALIHRPIISITSLGEFVGGSVQALTEQPLTSPPFDIYGYTINLTRGTIVRRANGVATPFADGVENIHVVYVAGQCADTAHVPANIAEGTLELIRINWQPIQAGNIPSFGNSSSADNYDSMDGFKAGGWLVPDRVIATLRPGIKRTGLA